MHNSTMPITDYGTVTLTGSSTPTDVSAISRQMTLVQKLLAEHREVKSLVEQRLNAVLRPSEPTATEGGAQQNPRSAPSPLVADLEGFAESLQRLLSGYQDILNRLEL